MFKSTAAVRRHRSPFHAGAPALTRAAALAAAAALTVSAMAAPAPVAAQDVTVVDYEPRNTLVVPENLLTRAKFPFVDIHGHQRASRMSPADVDRLVAEMDELNMAVMVNLSGGSGISLAEGFENMAGRHPGRFVFFANTNFFGVGEPGWGEEAAAQLEEDVRNGAAGLKIFKGLGMADRDTDGNRIAVDDPRLAPLWDKAGELGIPVLIHTADPAEFWQPHDRHNERWLELRLRPRRIRPPDRFPSFEQIIGEQHNLFRNHPNTNFIAAHLGWLGHDLGRLGELLDEIPNMYVGLGAVVYELGRQPRFARQWLIEYQDRVLMGKDSYNQEEFHTYFRVFETADDYFDYYRRYHAFWQMYGLDLPDEVLRKIYHANALKLVPGMDASLFAG
jgi:predicted TIM-barrel fold metal-dependent hydrolase